VSTIVLWVAGALLPAAASRRSAFERLVGPAVRAQFDFEKRIRRASGPFERRVVVSRFVALGLGILLLGLAAISTATLML